MPTRYLPYTVTLAAPAIVPQLAGDPNLVASSAFLPGSVIRGSFAARLGALPEPELEEVLLSGRVRFLNAYPTVRGVRALPPPLSFRRDKHTGARCDLAAYADDMPDLEGQLVPAFDDTQFVHLGTQFEYATTRLAREIHHQRDRQHGRAMTDPESGEARGTIFTYESIEASQSFAGVLAIEGDSDGEVEDRINSLRTAITGMLAFGRSRIARYGGRAAIAWEPAREVEIDGIADQLDVETKTLEAGRAFRAWLTSDYIGRDPSSGQLDPVALPGELEAALQGRATVERVYWGFRTIGAYNKLWGLSHPQAVVVRGGSVLCLRARSELVTKELFAIEHRGLGERRIEGFGRLVFLEEATREDIHLGPSPPRPRPTRPSAAPPSQVIEMQRRLLRELVERRTSEVLGLIARVGLDPGANLRVRGTPPSPSLLGRLRTILRAGIDQLGACLQPDNPVFLRAPATRQLRRCYLQLAEADPGPRPLLDLLRDLVDQTKGARMVDEALALTPRLEELCIVDRATSERMLADSDFGLRTRIAFIDILLAMLSRRARHASKAAKERRR